MTPPTPTHSLYSQREKNHRIEHFQGRFAGWDNFKGGLRDHRSALLLVKETKEAKRSKSYFFFFQETFISEI